MGFESEVFSGKLVPHDNNVSNLPNLAAWKRSALNDWVATGVPVILDVSNGYDGHLVFPDSAPFVTNGCSWAAIKVLADR